MSDPKFTPGPWRAIPAPHGVIDIFDAKDHDITTVFGDEESRTANANLMAAAPELFAALVACCEHMEYSNYQGRAAYARALEVLCKAAGKA